MKVLCSVIFFACVLFASANDPSTTEGLPSVELMGSTSDPSSPGHTPGSNPPAPVTIAELSSTYRGPSTLPEEPTTQPFTSHTFSKISEEALTTSTAVPVSAENTQVPLPVKEVTQPPTTTPQPTIPSQPKLTTTPAAVTTHATTTPAAVTTHATTTTKQVPTPMRSTTKIPMGPGSDATKIPGDDEEKSLATSIQTSTLLLPFSVIFIAFYMKH